MLVAAVVAFRHDSALVGPWCVAFLAGPLDLLHWRQRSFVRMAYNAGNRMVATLAGAATFTCPAPLGRRRLRHLGGAIAGAGIAGAALGAASRVRAGGRRRRRRARAAAQRRVVAERRRVSSFRWKRSPFPSRWSARAPVTSPPKWVGGPRLWCSRPRSSFRSSRSRGRGACTAITRVAATLGPAVARRRRARARRAASRDVDAPGVGRDRVGRRARAAGRRSRPTDRGRAHGRGGGREW